MRFDDAALLDHLADALAGLPTVTAVALGGSRATETASPDSDWDLAIYYRGPFDPADLRAIGWAGDVGEIGGWGGGVFNGGAWLTVDGRRVDIHYRDLEDVERRIADAERGRFDIERLIFHLAGVRSFQMRTTWSLPSMRRRRSSPPDSERLSPRSRPAPR